MHDNIAELFPEYWQNVPMGFDFIFAGEVYPGGERKDEAVHGESENSPPISVHSIQTVCRQQELMWGWEVRRNRQISHKTGQNRALLCDSLQQACRSS